MDGQFSSEVDAESRTSLTMLPRVIIHNMVSVDGRMDWFTPDLGLYYEVASRWDVDAILSGSETILVGFSDLEAQPEEPPAAHPDEAPEAPGSGPLMVIPDSRGRIRNWALIRRQQPYWRDALALVSAATSKEYLAHLQGEGVEFILTGDEHVDLRAALEQLHARHGIESVRVDSGGTLNGVLLREGLVSEISLLIGPSLVGGTSPRSVFVAPDLASPEGLIDVRLTRVEELRGGVVWLQYDVVR
jgi:2,5-diamino-6-(ribosylamino)-4(3H)-pyrimidinone 5'-phosphate reductase